MSPKLKAVLKKAVDFVKLNPFLSVILLLALFLLFFNLGGRILNGDEAGYSVLARNILEYGFPRMFNGEHFVGFEHQIGPDYAYMMNTWLGEYIIALSYLLFGVSNFTSRLFPALFGFATLVLLYFFSLKIAGRKNIALLSVFFLAMTPLFYYLSRSANYYAVAGFFILAVLYSYILLADKNYSRKYAGIFFSISSIFLFYTQIQLFFFTLIIIFAYFLIFNRKLWKRFVIPALSIFLFTFPYFLFWIFGSDVISAGVIGSFSVIRILVALCISLFYYFVLAFPVILLIFIPWILFNKFNKKHDKKNINQHYFFIIFFIIAIAVLNAVFDNLGAPAVRRIFIPTLPLFAILLASVTWKIRTWSKPAAFILVIALVASNALHIFPFSFAKPILSEIETQKFKSEAVTGFVNRGLRLNSPMYEYLYELTGNYVSPDDDILSVIKAGASPDDVYFTNADPSIPHFYTGLRSLINPEKTSVSFRNMPPDFIRQARIDWIIIRNLNKKEFENFIKANIDLSGYEMITLAQNDEPWADFANPINRRHRTDRNGEIVIYHLKE